MRPSPLVFFLIIIFLIWLDCYAYQATRFLIKDKSSLTKSVIRWFYIAQAIALIALTIYLRFSEYGTTASMFMLSIVFMAYASKLTAIAFVFIDDIRRVLNLFFAGRKRRYE